MSQVFRYVSAVSVASTVAAEPRRVQPTQNSRKESCPACNYSDNYYGDQVCLTATRR